MSLKVTLNEMKATTQQQEQATYGVADQPKATNGDEAADEETTKTTKRGEELT
jgi:hypothetical protein